MNRTSTRISRGLVGLLLITLVLGGAFYLHRAGRTHPAIAAAEGTPASLHASPNALPDAPPSAPPATQPLISPPTLPQSTPPIAAVPSPVSGQVIASSKSLVTETPKMAAVAMLATPFPTTQAAPTTQSSLTAEAQAGAPQTGATPAGAVQASLSVPGWSPTPSVVPPAPASTFLNDASAKVTAGDLLGARQILNDALLSGHLTQADTDAAHKALASINETVVFSPRRFLNDEYGGVYAVAPGDRLKKIAESVDLTWELLARINGISDPAKLRSGAKLKIIKGPFNIVVNKKAFTMDLYLGGTPGSPGSMYIRSYPVGLGRDDSTPTGTWLVDLHHKIKDPTYYSPRGEGVIAANDPKNPLGHRWIGLTGVDGKAEGQQSYGIHGTIDPDSIGKQASMGCIRMRNEDVEQVFDMVAEGKTTVIVRD